VKVHEFEGMVHGFFTLGKFFPQSNAAVALGGRALGDALKG